MSKYHKISVNWIKMFSRLNLNLNALLKTCIFKRIEVD